MRHMRLSYKTFTFLSLAATFFALGALQATDDSQIEMKRNRQDGCRQLFPKRGPTGPAGAQGSTGPTGPAGTTVTIAIAGSTSGNQNFTNTTATPFLFTDLYTPINIAHTNATANYTIGKTGTYLISWTVVVTPSSGAPNGGLDFFSITLNAGPLFSIPYNNVPAGGFGGFLPNAFIPQIVSNVMSGSVSVPLTAGDVVNLVGTSFVATAQAPTIGNADLTIEKISEP